MVTATTTVIASNGACSAPPNACPSTDPYTSNGVTLTFAIYFAGSGVTEDKMNRPSVSEFGTVMTTLPGTLSDCEAINQCAHLAQDQYVPYAYGDLDIHYRQSSAQWECVLFYGTNDDPSLFNQIDADVSAAYGYHVNTFNAARVV
nr:hypothetical protein CFP56_76070 [Quercus suber]